MIFLTALLIFYTFSQFLFFSFYFCRFKVAFILNYGILLRYFFFFRYIFMVMASINICYQEIVNFTEIILMESYHILLPVTHCEESSSSDSEYSETGSDSETGSISSNSSVIETDFERTERHKKEDENPMALILEIIEDSNLLSTKKMSYITIGTFFDDRILPSKLPDFTGNLLQEHGLILKNYGKINEELALGFHQMYEEQYLECLKTFLQLTQETSNGVMRSFLNTYPVIVSNTYLKNVYFLENFKLPTLAKINIIQYLIDDELCNSSKKILLCSNHLEFEIKNDILALQNPNFIKNSYNCNLLKENLLNNISIFNKEMPIENFMRLNSDQFFDMFSDIKYEGTSQSWTLHKGWFDSRRISEDMVTRDTVNESLYGNLFIKKRRLN